MPAVLDATENATGRVSTRMPPQLAKYAFKKGQPPPLHAGRPKGVQNAATIYMDSLPLKAKQWVKSTNPAVLIDARKLAIPDAEPVNPLAPHIIVFVGTSPSNNPLLVAADQFVDPSASVSLPPALPSHAAHAESHGPAQRRDTPRSWPHDPIRRDGDIGV